jgi:hypothetical protein
MPQKRVNFHGTDGLDANESSTSLYSIVMPQEQSYYLISNCIDTPLCQTLSRSHNSGSDKSTRHLSTELFDGVPFTQMSAQLLHGPMTACICLPNTFFIQQLD